MFGLDSGDSHGISGVFRRVFRRVSFTLQGNCASEVGCMGSLPEEMVVFLDSREIATSAGKGGSGGIDSSVFILVRVHSDMLIPCLNVHLFPIKF